MIVYNFSAEYAALVIIAAILLGFSREYSSEAIEYRFLKTMYQVACLSVIVTIAALVSGVPGTGILHLTVARVCNVLYFLCIPAVSLCFLVFARMITVLKFDEKQYRKRLFPAFIPYGIYLVILMFGLITGKVFSVTEAEGYVRGVWFEIPYVLVSCNLILVAVIIIKNLKVLHRDIKRTMLVTTMLAGIFLLVQLRSSTTIMTGIIHTACILSVHLYALNVRKYTDQMTGVYNRMYLIHKLEEHVKNQEACSLYVFSFRGMKTINERNGIAFGDKVLMRAAQILISRTTDRTVFRYSGDEFAIMLDYRHENHYAIVADIVADLDTVQTIDSQEVQLDFLYARVDFDLFGRNARELISAVDYSISSLKERTDGTRYIYDTAVVKALIKRANMVQQIKGALEENAFEVHYQPIYCKETGSFTQAEALVRMRDGEGYLVYPGDFIDLAVKTGLIVQITYLILEQVCQDMRYFMDNNGQGNTIETVSVNFPYLQFTDDNMKDKVMAILNRHQISPKMIKVEITEREMIADTAMTRELMADMRALGFEFELDDFGMDYSNMSVVLGLPLESIKLDRSFLLAALETEENQHFFRYLVKAIASIGATTICEGVEEQEQLDFVIACGCQYAQGYFFSKPLPREKLQEFLKNYQNEKESALSVDRLCQRGSDCDGGIKL